MVIDLTDELPVAAWSIGLHPKVSMTVHHPGANDPITDPIGALMGYANYHLTKDWSDAKGVQPADGIQYARAVDQQGNRYILRNRDSILWHCGVEYGNLTSIPVLALLSNGERPTTAMLLALSDTQTELAVPWKYPHGPLWVSTKCPGDYLRAWAQDHEQPQEDADMADETTIREWAKEEARVVLRLEYGPALEAELIQRFAENSSTDIGSAVAAAVKAVGDKLTA